MAFLLPALAPSLKIDGCNKSKYMKKILTVTGLLFGSFAVTQTVAAQVRVGININIGDQPSWRDPGYDYVEYYYLPDIECYYYVPRHQFIYLSNGRWVFSASLPARHRHYDLYSGNKVVVNRPYTYRNFDQDRRHFGKRYYFNNRNNGNRHHNGWKKHKRH